MKWLCIPVALAAACQPEGAPPPQSAPAPDTPTTAEAQGASPYQRDVDRICNAERLSGSLEVPEGGRAMHVGVWLGTNLESQEGRELSAALSKLAPPERITRLSQEAQAQQITDCQMLTTWGG